MILETPFSDWSRVVVVRHCFLFIKFVAGMGARTPPAYTLIKGHLGRNPGELEVLLENASSNQFYPVIYTAT